MERDEQLYGFDARSPIRGHDPQWTPQRRASYLLRAEVRRPLSVDRHVWPPVSPAAATDGQAPDYWARLDVLRETCTAAGLAEAACTLVALTVRGRSSPAAGSLRTSAIPSDVDPSWLPLGHDVADTGLTSGLSNAGLLAGLDDADALRSRWGPKLNDDGLFDRFADAEEFCAFSNRRIPEHAPFLVHRIYVIPW